VRQLNAVSALSALAGETLVETYVRNSRADGIEIERCLNIAVGYSPAPLRGRIAYTQRSNRRTEFRKRKAPVFQGFSLSAHRCEENWLFGIHEFDFCNCTHIAIREVVANRIQHVSSGSRFLFLDQERILVVTAVHDFAHAQN